MTQELILRQWHNGICLLHQAHFECARHYELRHLWLGIPVVVLSTAVGTTIFATLEKTADIRVRIVIGLLSVVSAVLAGLQTFLRYSERAEKHKTAAVRYGALRRDLEQAVATCTPDRPCTPEYMERLRLQWDALDAEAPTVRKRVYEHFLIDARARAQSSVGTGASGPGPSDAT